MAAKKVIKMSWSLGQLNRVYSMLDVPLHGEEIRQRNAFIKIINPHVDSIGVKREEILKEFSNKDEKGIAKIVNGMYDIPEEKRDESLTKLREFLASEVIIEAQKSTISSIFGILKTKTGNMKIEEGEIYSAIMDKLEEVI